MDSFPKCHVCQQLFTLKGPAPYLLPCLHAVCETCVASTSSGVISCSSCQTQVNLTETHLQKDAVRQREIFHLTVQHRPSELLCTHDDDGNQAVCWCQDCEEFLCENCQNMHESFKAFRRHSVQNIGDIQPGSLQCEEYCSIHPKFILEFQDKVCNIQICSRCRRSDHAEHDVEDIDAAADLARTEMGGQLKEVQEAVTRHTSYLEVTKEQIQKTEETSQTLENQIIATFSSLKTLLVQREKELLIALEKHKEKSKSVGLQTEVFQSKYKKCQVTSEYIHKTLLYCSKYDLLNLRNQLGERTRDCLASAHPCEPEDFPATVFSMDGLEKLKTLMSSFGAIGPPTNVSTLQILKKDNAVQVEIEQFSEVEDQYKQSIQQLEDHLSTSNSQLEELQKMMKDMTIQKEKAVQDVTRLTREKENARQDVTRLTREKKKKKDEEDVTRLTREKENADQDVTRLTREKKKAGQDVTRLSMGKVKAEQNVTRLTMENEQLQQGVTRLAREKEDLKNSHERAAFLEKQLRQQGIYLLKPVSVDKAFLLQCTQLKFDCDKVNIDKAHINTDGDLVNKPGTKPLDDHKDRFVKYYGTTSTVPLPLCGSPQYWEVRGGVDIDKDLSERNLLLETGLCIEEKRDQHHYIGYHPQSYSLTVALCPKHNSICRKVWRHGKHLLCLSDTFSNTPRQSAALHFGVVFDDVRCRVTFVDVSANTVISTLKDVDCSRSLWPMFGVHNPHLASVSMSLVVGTDIDMSEKKRELILDSLS